MQCRCRHPESSPCGIWAIETTHTITVNSRTPLAPGSGTLASMHLRQHVTAARLVCPKPRTPPYRPCMYYTIKQPSLGLQLHTLRADTSTLPYPIIQLAQPGVHQTPNCGGFEPAAHPSSATQNISGLGSNACPQKGSVAIEPAMARTASKNQITDLGRALNTACAGL